MDDRGWIKGMRALPAAEPEAEPYPPGGRLPPGQAAQAVGLFLWFVAFFGTVLAAWGGWL